MTDSAEMGERPADPATRAGIGVGAGTDDYVDGAAEQQFETDGSTSDAAWQNPTQADADGPPGEAQKPFADTDAMASRMSPVDEWGTGDADLPYEGPAEELESDV
jgi:hypothetical protein